MNSTTRNSHTAEWPVSDGGSMESPPVAAEAESSGSAILLLLPHILAVLFIWALVAITPIWGWKVMSMGVTVTVGPVLSTLLLTAGVCLLLSLATLGWFCNRGSQRPTQRTSANIAHPEAGAHDGRHFDAA